MVMVTLEKLTKRYPGKTLFEDANLGIEKGDRIGLIGENGCGKSTFLKILMGAEPADSGSIVFRSGIKTGYLPQVPSLDPNKTIFEQIYYSDHEHFRVLRQFHDLTTRLAKKPSDALMKQHQELMHDMEARDIWSIETKARSLLTRFGFDDLDRNTANLSGGEKRRIDMARVLLDEPDFLALDEPTNHLDIDTIEWLQDYMKSYQGTMIFVTHDRYFLDDVCNRIFEIDNGQLRIYPDNYSGYLKRKELELIDIQRKETRRKAQLQKEMKWLQRGAKARSSKPKDHIDRVKELLDKSYLSEDRELEISFREHRLGKTILEAGDITKSYDKELFKDFSHIFQKRERIGIIGPNGSGKTTLLRILLGTEEPDSGKVKLGVNTKFAVLDQESKEFEKDITVLDYIREEADRIRTADGTLLSASEMLERFRFDGKMQQSKLFSLSGGERKRLALMKSLMFGANFVVLDEPTNDLDIQTLEVLEDYLDAFRGCLLTVSHDRYFLDRIVDYLFVFTENAEGGTEIRKFPGNYSDYYLVKRYQDDEKQEIQKRGKPVQTRRHEDNTGRLSYKDERRVSEIEKSIDELERKKKELDFKLTECSSDLKPRDFIEINDQLAEIGVSLEQLMEEWMEIENKRN